MSSMFPLQKEFKKKRLGGRSFQIGHYLGNAEGKMRLQFSLKGMLPYTVTIMWTFLFILLWDINQPQRATAGL